MSSASITEPTPVRHSAANYEFTVNAKNLSD